MTKVKLLSTNGAA